MHFNANLCFCFVYFRIEVKERSMEEMLYELRVLKDKNERLKERVFNIEL